MRPGTTEYALMICFKLGLYPQLTPLGHPSKLANPDYPVPISFIYGEADWVRSLDEDYAKIVVAASQFPESKFHLVSFSDHNMHMDNPIEFANIIISDIF